jgi:hypothetical protein
MMRVSIPQTPRTADNHKPAGGWSATDPPEVELDEDHGEASRASGDQVPALNCPKHLPEKAMSVSAIKVH